MIDFSILRSNTFAGKIVRLPFRFLPRGMVVPILQGPLRGKKWLLGSQRQAFWLGGYEPQMQAVIARELDKGNTFYDIGANVGFYSLLGAFRVAPGTVFAFEPLPANIEYLQRHLVLNQAQNIQVMKMAISDEVGTSKFQAEQTGAMGRIDSAGNLSVNVSTLDALLVSHEISPPHCIKMDIEGQEFRALLGAKMCFEKYRPKLFLATHGVQVHAQCCHLLCSWKYEIREIGVQSAERGEIFASPV
jgi:FkbM family methyltransferase